MGERGEKRVLVEPIIKAFGYSIENNPTHFLNQILYGTFL